MAKRAGNSLEQNEHQDFLIGKGTLGKVHRRKLNGKYVAVKVINAGNQDFRVLGKVAINTNIIEIIVCEYWVKESEISISMELLDQNLDEYIASKQLSDEQIEDLLCQCASGICFLHDNNEVHRRMKPSNFLIQLKGPDDIIVKVADWFLEKTQEDAEVYSHWCAPEESTTKPVTADEMGYKMNVFSFAILIMYVGGKEEGREKILDSSLGEDISNEKNVLELFSILWQSIYFRDFIIPLVIKTLSLDPKHRPTMTTVSNFLERKLSYPQLQLERIRKNIISTGSFGVVYRGTYDGKMVAIKTINKHHLDESRRHKVIKSETVIWMKKLRNSNIIHILACEDKTPYSRAEIWIGMELCDCSLDKYLAKNHLDEKETRSILCQSARGLLYLHEEKLLHGDFKPNNILIKEGAKNNVKITDFSLTKDIEGRESTTMTSVHGNPHWLTPEQMTTDTFEKKEEFEYKGSNIFPVDVFQFALILIYVCISQEERDKMFQTIYVGQMVKNGENVLDYFAPFWNHENLRCHLEPLLKKILVSDPEQRPTMNEVIEFFCPPNISNIPPLVMTHITSHSLGFDADVEVGISSSDSCVLVGRREGIFLNLFNKPGQLLLYQLQDNEIKQLWEKDCPDGVDCSDIKFISGHGDDLLLTIRDSYIEDDPTLCYDGELQQRHTHRVGEGMRLIGVLPGAGHRMVYREETTNPHLIHIYANDSRVLSLRAPPSIQCSLWWWWWLSVCHEARSGWFAVTDSDSSSLCIYNEAGVLQHHVELTCRPAGRNAVTCTRHHILVSQYRSTVVHIHAWDGQYLSSVDLKDKVQLKAEEGRVYALTINDGGQSLIVAIGRSEVNPEVTSLHALKIE